MLKNELYIADKNLVVALWLHKLSVDEKAIVEIVLKNDFLQKWVGKERVHKNALYPLENALGKYFPSLLHYPKRRNICGPGRVLILPCRSSSGRIMTSDGLGLLNLPKMAKDLGLRCYSSQ